MSRIINKSRIILLVVITLLFSVIISQASFAKSSLTEEDEAMFSQNDILFYEPCSTQDGGSSTSEICGSNQNYAGTQVFTDAQMEAIKHFQPFYEKAASQYGFPWEILAVLHYREHSLEKSNPPNGQGVYQLYSYTDGGENSNAFWPAGAISDEEFQRQTDLVARLINESYGKGKDLNTDDGVKHMFFTFNGVGDGVVFEKKAAALGFSDPAEGSAYVMNKYDEQRDPSSPNVNPAWIGNYTSDGNWSAGAKDERWGTFTAYKALTCTGDNAAHDDSDDTSTEYEDNSNTNAGVSPSTPSSSNIAKKIAETALNLAYSYADRSKASGNPTDNFIEATKELGTWDKNKSHGPDCGFFVKAVLATVDPDIVYKPDNANMDIFRNQLVSKNNSWNANSNKYTEKYWDVIDFKDGDTSKLQSGDVIWGYKDSSHQHYFIVVDIGGKLYKVEASYTGKKWGRVTGQIGKKYNKYKTQKIFRVKSETDDIKPSCDAKIEGSKNINATGAALAWPLGTDESKYTLASGKVLESALSSPGQTTDFAGTGSGNLEFQKAWVKAELWKSTFGYNSTQKGRYSWRYGAYCSGFTATVVRYSGYDKHFTSAATVGKYEQAEYAQKHPDLWDVEVWDKEKSSLKGGDILLSAEHSWMVVEDENGELYVAEGSLHSYAFGHIVKYKNSYSSKTYRIRAKNALNSNVGVSVTDGVKTSSTSGTITSSVQNSHNIGAVARFFAWPEGTDSSTTINGPKEPEVWKTLLKENGFSNFSSTAMGKDCGVFVGGVLRYAGLVTRIKHKNGQGSVPIVPSEVDEGENGWYRVDTDGTKESELQDGDVIFHYKDGKLKHFSIFLRGENGEALTAQASHGDWYGRISKYHTYGQEVVYRNKNNKTGNEGVGGSSECDLCPSQENSDGSINATIVDGGFKTEAEAQKVVDAYLNTDLNTLPNMGYACEGNLHRNCVNFSKWFISTYLKGMSTDFLGNGGDIADAFYEKNKSKFPNLKESKVPVAYSIFSVRNAPNLSSSEEGHTGVILGVNGNKVIFGEAAWCGTAGKVRTLPVSDFTSGRYYKFIDVNAYINGGI